MSGYLPTIRHDTSYEGDDVSIEMSAMTRNAFIKIMPVVADARGQDDKTSKMAVYGAACDVLADHILSVNGLRDKNGNAVTRDALLGAVYFIDLVIETFNRLIQECSLGKLKSTGSEGKSPESTAAPTLKISH